VSQKSFGFKQLPVLETVVKFYCVYVPLFLATAKSMLTSVLSLYENTVLIGSGFAQTVSQRLNTRGSSPSFIQIIRHYR